MEYPYLIDGEWLDDGEALEVRSPFTGETVGLTHRPPPARVEEAVRAAAAAFAKTRRMPTHERTALLARIAAAIRETANELAAGIALEAGKPMRYARGEVARAAQTFDEAAAECSRLYGEVIPLDVSPAAEGRLGFVRHVPAGPVLAITPFNFPLNLVAHKVAPALAAGCPVVLKPASATPLTALRLARIVTEAGAPPGALAVLPIGGKEAGVLAERGEIRTVSFTGSAAVGWELGRRASRKKVTLELGGNAAAIVHGDWEDIERAVSRIVMGAFAFSGQVCISVQRVYVHRRVADRFREKLFACVAALRAGDPLDEETDIGPMIDDAEAARVAGWLEEAVAGGAVVAAGGGRRGAFHEPTVVEEVRPGMKIVDEEVFGPVLCLADYDGIDEALAAAGRSRFGLQAGVFARDIGVVMRAWEELEVGGVIAGDVPTFRVDRMPYGGVRDSGRGREGLRWAIRGMCEPRLLVIAP